MRVFELQRTRRAMIALFLAVLEMVRMQAVVVTQKDLFGEIALKRHEQLRPGFRHRAAHGRDRERLHLISSMEELEPNPQGESPEPEPAPPVAEPVTGGPPEDAAPAEDAAPEPSLSEPSLSVDELMATRDVPFEDTPAPVSQEDSQIKAILEAIVYVAESRSRSRRSPHPCSSPRSASRTSSTS